MTDLSADAAGYQSRDEALWQVEREMRRRGSPRVVMAWILAATGAVGFLFSYGMLHWGVDRMAVRYPAAVLLAYGVFLFMLRAWADTREPARRRSLLERIDVDLPNSGGSSHSAAAGHSPAAHPTSGAKGGGLGGGLSLDLDDGLFLLIAAVGLASVLISAVWVLWITPSLFAEVALDAALVTGLYRRVRPSEQRWWVRSAVAYTWAPLLLAMLMLSVCGCAMQALAPDARSIGGVWEAVHHPASPAEP